VTGSDAGVTNTVTLTVTAAAPASLTLSPASAAIAAGASRAFSATGTDAYGNSNGDVTGTSSFTIAPAGSGSATGASCTANVCTATVAGSYVVTGTNGGATGAATLTVSGGSNDAGIAELRSLIAGYGLDKGLTNDLLNRLSDVSKKLGNQTDACHGLDDFLQKVIDEAGTENAKLLIAQAGAIVLAGNRIETALGCIPAGSPKPGAEQDVLALIGTINALALQNGTENDLRSSVRNIGKQLASDSVASACLTLGDLAKKIVDQTGKGLNTTQAAQLQAAVAHISAELGCS
jgi:hypothetical protein